jgi:hypothetical protein
LAAIRRRIGEVFVQLGYVTSEELDAALRVQQETRKHLGEILVERGKLSRLDLASALSEQWNVRELSALEAASEPGQADRPVGETRELVLRLESQLAGLSARHTTDMRNSQDAYGQLCERLERQQAELSTQHAVMTDAIRAESERIAVLTESLERRIQAQLDHVQAELAELREQLQAPAARKPTTEPEARGERKPKKEKKKP